MAKKTSQSLGTHVPGTLRVAIVSDLHAFEDNSGATRPSHFCTRDSMDDVTSHPVAALLALCQQEALMADLLLCCGDIAEKAHPTGLKEGWSAVHRIGEVLGVHLVAGTAGNHDVDSRFQYNDYDARGYLQSLDPPFPLPDESENDRYWSRHFVIRDHPAYRLVVLNSAAYHGTGPEEYQNGRIAQSTLAALRQGLEAIPNRPANILLCHHHPHQHSEMGLGEEDVMKGGQLLIDTLGSGQYDRWFIVHGHKHHPKLETAQGGGSAPVVFAAGSLCASLVLALQTGARNQFYLFTFPYDRFQDMGFGGTFRAWDWHIGTGWQRAGPASGLPAVGGFGYRPDPKVLAKEISNVVVEAYLPWQDFLTRLPKCEFVQPADMHTVRRLLEEQFHIHIFDEYGLPCQIGRRQ